jgi:hypothetical protein
MTFEMWYFCKGLGYTELWYAKNVLIITSVENYSDVSSIMTKLFYLLEFNIV